jgi:predicted enzyme related to lactoylglutathione lyase
MSALVIFSVDVRRLAAFYETVLGAKSNQEPSGDIRLRSDQDEVLIHSIPAKIAKTIEVQIPHEPRNGSPIKPVFDVDSLKAALKKVEDNGGAVTGKSFSIDGLTRQDMLDPDGNVIQLRGRK